MKAGWTIAVGLAALLAVGGACSSSSAGGGGGDATSGGLDGGGSGVVTYSCTGGGLCTQIDGPPSAMSGEQSACAMQMGTFAVASCAPSGILACCVHAISVGTEQQCYYAPDYSNPNSLSVAQSTCASLHRTWTVSDAGAGIGPSNFVGTWARTGMQTVTCPTGSPTTTSITGKLVITLGTTSGTIVGTQPDGCAETYTVSGNVATASAGQTCDVMLDGGAKETVTVTSHTLTLSADGLTLMSMSSDTIDKLATATMCTSMGLGTYAKQ
jgi:hypothetical protein